MTSHVDSSTLQHYLHVFRRRKWIVLQASVLVPLAAVLFSLHQQHLYRATAEVWFNNKDFTALLGYGVGYTDPNRTAATNADLARVPAIASRALRAAHITDRSPSDFLDHSGVAPKSNADLVDFNYNDPIPAVAAKLATAYARAFIVFRHQLDTTQLKRAEAQVKTQLKELEAIGNTHSPLYLTLVQKEQQLQALESLLTPPVLTRAPTSALQIQPRPTRNAVLGLILGVIAGIGLAFLREALDTRMRSVEEISQRLALPLLARLPEPPARLRNESKLSMLEEPTSTRAEAFRVLRTNLDFVNLERGAQIIMITSALEAEGKSTTVANLAVAFARGGSRVIVVDLDLRRPLLDRLFRLGKRPGLTQAALGQTAIEDVLVPIAISDAMGRSVLTGAPTNGRDHSAGLLEVLPAGALPPDVGEFVGSRKLGEILERLRALADIVLVDTPPLLRVGDAITLSGKVDAMLIAVNLATARRPVLDELRRVLERCPAEKLGFVVTGADLEEGYGYGGLGYGYYGEHSEAAEVAASATR